MFKKVASYSAGLYIATVIASIVRVIVKSVIAKTVGKEALGTYAFFMSAQAIGISLLAFGLVRTLAKHVAAASKDNKDAGQTVSAVLALLTGISAALVGIAFLFRQHLDWIWVGILIGVGPATLFTVAKATLRGQFDRNRELIATFANTIIQAVSVILMIVLVANPAAPVVGLVIANLIIAAFTLFYFIKRQPATWKLTPLRQCFKSIEFKNMTLLAVPLWFTDMLAVIGHQADLLIVQGQLGFESLAEYAAAFTFIGLLSRPISVLARMFLVTFASGFYTSIDKYKQVASLNLVFLTTLGMGVTVLSIPLTPIIFTSEYTLTPLLAAILSTAFVFKSAEVLNTSLTIAQDYPRANLNSKIWTTAIYLPLAYFLVVRFGVIGAAISNVFSWGGYALIHAYYMGKQFPEHAAHTFRQSLVGTILYTTVVATVLFINSIWIILIAVPIYLALGHLLRAWNLFQLWELAHRLIPERLANYTFPSKEKTK